MKEIIATGKTVDLAIEEACQQLGVPREKAEFEIIDLPKKGLFGLKTYPAKVRVFVKEDKAEMAVEYISSILRAMGARSFSATPSLEGENLHITLQGDDLGFVIGRRGETIDAIQYLTSLAVNRLDGDYMRITIDSGNFREKREKTLESLAKRLARNVVRSGRSVTLEPMNPYERRIIHATVSTIEGATSSSIGEEPNRRVVISSTNPVKKNNNYKGKKKPYNNKGGRRSGSRRPQGEGKGQGQNQENREGGEKKPYVFRQNSNREEGENRRRQPRKDSYKGERRQEEKAASNDNIRSEVPRSTPPSEAQDKPLYAKIDLD